MPDLPTPVAELDERPFTELRQLTVVNDEQISTVNRLLAECWRLVHIGQRSDATVYVLGRREDRPKHRTGFLQAD